MKKDTIKYLKAIWFKITNDQMTLVEALFLFAILAGIAVWVTHMVAIPPIV